MYSAKHTQKQKASLHHNIGNFLSICIWFGEYTTESVERLYRLPIGNARVLLLLKKLFI